MRVIDREERLRAGGSGSNNWFGGYMYPVLGVPKVPAFIAEVEQALAGDAEPVHGPQARLEAGMGPTATRLSDGRVLVVGGDRYTNGAHSFFASVESYPAVSATSPRPRQQATRA